MKYTFPLLFLFIAALNVNGQNILEATGNAGIGTTTPTEKLEISSNGLSIMKLTHIWDVLGTVGAIKQRISICRICRLPGKLRRMELTWVK